MKTSVQCPKCTFKKAKHSGVYNPSTEEVETRGCLGLTVQTAESNWQAPGPSERLLKRRGQLLRWDPPLASTCTHRHAPSHIHRNVHTNTHTLHTQEKETHNVYLSPFGSGCSGWATWSGIWLPWKVLRTWRSHWPPVFVPSPSRRVLNEAVKFPKRHTGQWDPPCKQESVTSRRHDIYEAARKEFPVLLPGTAITWGLVSQMLEFCSTAPPNPHLANQVSGAIGEENWQEHPI